jgi:hypothetical protein
MPLARRGRDLVVIDVMVTAFAVVELPTEFGQSTANGGNGWTSDDEHGR